jgi:hypothetical protein
MAPTVGFVFSVSTSMGMEPPNYTRRAIYFVPFLLLTELVYVIAALPDTIYSMTNVWDNFMHSRPSEYSRLNILIRVLHRINSLFSFFLFSLCYLSLILILNTEFMNNSKIDRIDYKMFSLLKSKTYSGFRVHPTARNFHSNKKMLLKIHKIIDEVKSGLRRHQPRLRNYILLV